MEKEPYQILYKFSFEDGRKKHFKIMLDQETISILRPGLSKNPRWAKLKYNKCRCCPLEESNHPYCPIAVNISDIVESFKHMFSSEDCTVRCVTPERTYMKKTSTMEGISSIFGVIMATSNCPVMDFLKPMARFHLPFGTLEETMVRVTSMYLLRQYFSNKKEDRTVLDFNELDLHYARVQQVNEGLVARINPLIKKDANKNALIILHSLCKLLSMEIDVNMDSIKYLFTLKPDSPLLEDWRDE